MHAEAYRWISDTLERLPPPSRVLEFGSRNINGTPRMLMPVGVEYIGIDLVHGPCVDFVANAKNYRPHQKADLVLCCEVLEHSEYAADIVRNAVACVAPGGHLLITCATFGRAPHSAVDGGVLRAGEFYRNVAASFLESWLIQSNAGPIEIRTHDDRGDLYALAQVPA